MVYSGLWWSVAVHGSLEWSRMEGPWSCASSGTQRQGTGQWLPRETEAWWPGGEREGKEGKGEREGGGREGREGV